MARSGSWVSCKSKVHSSHRKPIAIWIPGRRTDNLTDERMNYLGSNLGAFSLCISSRGRVRKGKRKIGSYSGLWLGKEESKFWWRTRWEEVAIVILETEFNSSVSSLSHYYDRSHEAPQVFSVPKIIWESWRSLWLSFWSSSQEGACISGGLQGWEQEVSTELGPPRTHRNGPPVYKLPGALAGTFTLYI